MSVNRKDYVTPIKRPAPAVAPPVASLISKPDDYTDDEWSNITRALDFAHQQLTHRMSRKNAAAGWEYAGLSRPSGENTKLYTDAKPFSVSRIPGQGPEEFVKSIAHHSHPHIVEIKQAAHTLKMPVPLSRADLIPREGFRGITSVEPEGGMGWAIHGRTGRGGMKSQPPKEIRLMAGRHAEEAARRAGATHEVPLSMLGNVPEEYDGNISSAHSAAALASGLAMKRLGQLERFGYRAGTPEQKEMLRTLMKPTGAAMHAYLDTVEPWAKDNDIEIKRAEGGEVRGNEAFNHPDLTAHQNKVVEMWRNGYKSEDIADEMNNDSSCISSTLHEARKKLGADVVPIGKAPGASSPYSNDDLAKMHAALVTSGHPPSDARDIMSERTGIRARTIYQRLYYHRKARAGGGRVDRAPTEAQKEAGNYRKEHVRFQGLDISIENKKGSTRSGIGAGGKRWSCKLPADYGYIKGTLGADGDHVDVYLGPDKASGLVVVINQKHLGSGKFDEHKVMLGFPSETDAVGCYVRAFSDGNGMKRIASVETISMDTFRNWLARGNTEKPAKSNHMVSHALKIAKGLHG